MVLYLLIAVAIVVMVLEKFWPAGALPVVRGWYWRVALLNMAQLGVLILAGVTWERWLQPYSLFNLKEHWGDVSSALVAYAVSCFVFYWWHRFRHESPFFWRLCHQIHHSPRRIE